MKKLTLSLLLIFAVVTTYAQSYLISFDATGIVTTLDSIKTENITQGTSLTISGTDVLHLTGTTGINDYTSMGETVKVSPNPMQGQTEISFYAKEAGNTQVLVYDISGRKVLQTDCNLSLGIQQYQLRGLKQGQYFLKIIGENYFYTSKLISQNTTIDEAKIEYVGSEKQEKGNVKPETSVNKIISTKSTIDMDYTTGDNLLFIGYSGTYNSIILDTPTISKTITFNFSNFICGTSTITDIDGNSYNTVSIGNQCWMGENLKTTHYSNGIAMVDGTNAGDINQNYTTKYYFDYDNTPSNTIIYGKLYTWAAAMNGAASSITIPSGVQGPCPIGWHIPSDAEWTTLTNNLGGDSVAGGKLKEIGYTNWLSPNTGATNVTGFTALPGGYRYTPGNFSLINTYGYWWSSSEFSAINAWFRFMSFSQSYVGRDYGNKTFGFSIRCLMDF